MINLRFPLMRFSFPLLLVTSALALSLPCSARAQAPAPAAPAKGQYQNFVVAIYIPVAVVNTFAEPGRLDSEWRRISSQLKVDKVYIEAHRDRVVADEALLETVKKFFLDHGVRAAGGITFTDAPADGAFGSFCYTNPADREFAKKAMERVARHFDEIILDDYFFVTTKNDSDIAAKDPVPARFDERGRPGPRRRRGQGGQSARQGDHQIPELVRAFRGPRFRS
jgi:hypothetical protein